jgi:hypothetical protein
MSTVNNSIILLFYDYTIIYYLVHIIILKQDIANL